MEGHPNIFFRADGNAKIGHGHVIRSLALAEMLSHTFNCHFIIRDPKPSIRKEVESICQDFHELDEAISVEEEPDFLINNILNKNDLLVLDGYHFKTTYQTKIKSAGYLLVCIDDIHAYHFVANVVINHAGGISRQDYSLDPQTHLFLGPQYALVRSPFREAARYRTPSQQKEDATFICLGGADPQNHTLEVLRKCEEKEIKKCYLVLGASYQHHDDLHTFLTTTRLEVVILNNLSAEEMVAYMQRCKNAITPPSSVAYEYLSVGGELYLLIIADNQKRMYSYFIGENLAFDLDEMGAIDTALIDKALIKQYALFDGNQQKRLSYIFHSLLVSIRKANRNDSDQFFEWANDPFTRSQSFQQNLITHETHDNWFQKKLTHQASNLYICQLGKIPIGQVRFEVEGDNAILSYSVARTYRGKGLGKVIIKLGVAAIREERDDLVIIGYVKKDNYASCKTFLNLGFFESEATEYKNSFKYILGNDKI